MRKRLFSWMLAAMCVIGIAGIGLTQDSEMSAENSDISIDGTYVLKKRVMADSSELASPDVGGMMTFNSGHRNLNVFWKNPDGSISSRSLVTEYTLSNDGYTEKSLFLVDQNLMGEDLKSLMTQESGTGKVTISGNEIAITMPLFGEPLLTVTPDGLTANMAGQWIDYWEKVE